MIFVVLELGLELVGYNVARVACRIRIRLVSGRGTTIGRVRPSVCLLPL